MAITLNSASFLFEENGGLSTRLAWTSDNIVFANLQADAAWATYDSYYLKCEVGIFDINTSTFTPLGKPLIEEPDADGTIIFEVQKIMDDSEEIKVPVPSYNSTQVEVHEVPTFYVKIFEVIDNVETQIDLDGMTGALGSPESSWRILAIQAGLDREHFNYQLQQDWIFDTEKRKFLTSVEDEKSSHKEAQEFLYWYAVLPNQDNLSVFSKIYYDDGTEEDIILFDSVLQGQDIQIIPTRYALIKAKSTQPKKNISSWSIYVAKDTFRVCEYFRYELPNQPNREAKFFLYRNSLGVFDTLVCAGDFEEYLESENEYATKRDGVNYELSEAQKQLVEQTATRGGTANTAYLNRAQADSKQDFIISKEILIQEKNQFIPVIVPKQKQIYNIKNSSLLGYSFEYQHAHNIRKYTKDIFRPKLGEIPSPQPLPKFRARFYGASAGYVRVEYDGNVIDLALDTELALEIPEGTSIKVTWLTVNPDTGLLDASKVNIDYPTYAFPARIVKAVFDSVVQAGSTVTGINDVTTRFQAEPIVQARTFTLTMPAAEYVVEVEFREMKIFADFDFEHPDCVDIVDGNVAAINDRLNNFNPLTQSNPSQRPVLIGNKVFFSSDGLQTLESVDNNRDLVEFPTKPTGSDGEILPFFLLLEFENFDANNNVSGNLAVMKSTASFKPSLAFSVGTSLRIDGRDWGVTNFKTSSYATKKFLISSNTNGLYTSGGLTPVDIFQRFVFDGDDFPNYGVNKMFTGFHQALKISSSTVANAKVSMSCYRIIVMYDDLTQNEQQILYNKMKTKYNIT